MKRLLLLGLAVVAAGSVWRYLRPQNPTSRQETPPGAQTVLAPSQAEEAPPTPPPPSSAQSSQSYPPSDLHRLSELVSKSSEESKVCLGQLEDARRLLGSSLGQAIQTLAKLPVAPRSSQEGIALIGRSLEVAHAGKNDRFFTEAAALQACDPAGQLDFVRDLIAAVKTDGRPELRQALSESLVEYFARDADRPNTLMMNIIRIRLLQNAVDDSLLPAEFRPSIAALQAEAERIRTVVVTRNRTISLDDADGQLQSYVNEVRASEPLRQHYAEFAGRLRPISTVQNR